MSKEKADGPTRTRFRDVLHSYDKEKRSEVVYYHSPQTGNDWMAWYRMISNGYGQVPTMRDYEVCYQMTDQYMTIQLPTTIVYKDIEVKGISMFTDHMFMRMHQRLGVDMSDRKTIIQNFVETTMCGCIDIRDPREGEKDKQIINRLPASWLRGHIIEIGDMYLARFNTFMTDKDLSAKQRRYLMSFAKFADSFTDKNEIKNYFQ